MVPVTANMVSAASVYNKPLAGSVLKLKLAIVPSMSVPCNTTATEATSSLALLVLPIATGPSLVPVTVKVSVVWLDTKLPGSLTV